MAVDIEGRTLAWSAATGDEATLLQELQPNILKGHVREHLVALFLRFTDPVGAGVVLSTLATAHMKSARTHLEEVRAHAATGTPGTTYVGVGLTRAGYDALGVAEPLQPTDPAFRDGMRDFTRRTHLADPPPSTWDATYAQEIHAVVLVGDASADAVDAVRNAVEALLPDSVTIVGVETGAGQRNAAGDGIEHFGYVDGRSQPLFLQEDVDAEAHTTGDPGSWDPAFTLDRLLVADPAAPDPGVHFGSYFVFRKLEQNVRRFRQIEAELAAELGLSGPHAARAGALLVGRFRDGTPLTTHPAPGAVGPVTNDFTYAADGSGLKCPFQAHIRKTNPRGSGGFEDPLAERRHIMARRGQTYGERTDDPTADALASERPAGGVGLLFMAFNANIEEQFEFTQRRWANAPGFPKTPAGTAVPSLDPVIAQGPRPEMANPLGWGSGDVRTTAAVAQTVRMKGGEYFFMPSLAFLRSL